MEDTLLIDARTLPEHTMIEAEVCIIGAGAAGITVAREFIGQPFRVCLLESGGLEFEEDTQDLYAGENIGHPYFQLDRTRLRFLGGTTNHWGGFCRPLDQIDFEIREWIPHSGWPFDKTHLAPFYERAQTICQLGPFTYDVKDWETEDTPRIPFVGDRVVTQLFQFSPPTHFGKVYRVEIERATNVRTFLYANVVDIETSNNTRTVTRARVACLQGNRFWVSAKLFILAAGGIENPRLLLLSNKVQRAGLGNQNDLVGRFFMEHPEFVSGSWLLSDPSLPLGLYKVHPKVNNGKKVKVRGMVTLSSEILRSEGLLSASATLEPSDPRSEGVASAQFPLEATRRGYLPDDFMEHLSNVIADIDNIDDGAIGVYRKFLNRIQSFPIVVMSLYNRIEQAPNPESRVVLSDQRDSLGQYRVRLDWQLGSIDKRSIRRTHEIVGQELGRAGLGRLRLTLDEGDTTWPHSMRGGNHHIGTTRMHIDPKKGVVDENCQVHGVSNLFIAGSSVFPTGGSANPTLTIVALAVKLADHLKRLMI
jgi:choline dehydrogenase-like flavoprotein